MRQEKQFCCVKTNNTVNNEWFRVVKYAGNFQNTKESENAYGESKKRGFLSAFLNVNQAVKMLRPTRFFSPASFQNQTWKG